MRVGIGHRPNIGSRLLIAVLTLLIAGCSQPEEVISRRLTQANQNLDAGRVEEAIKILETLNGSHPDQPAVLEALGFAHARAGQHAAAATSFVRAADMDPRSGSLRQLAAESYQREGALDRAAQQHRLYLQEFPGDFNSWEKLGQIEEQNGNLVRANDAYLECYRVKPSGEIAWRLGQVFRRLNNAPQAKAWFDTTIRHADARVGEALLGLLELEIGANDFAAAERTVGQLDRNFPGTIETSPLAGIRADLAAWKEQQAALNAARAVQDTTRREMESERRRREAELSTPETTPVSPPQIAAPAPVATASLPAPRAAVPTSTPTPTPGAAVPEVAPAAAPSAPEPTRPVPDAPPLPADFAAAVAARDRGELDAAVALLWTLVANDDSRVDAWMELGATYRLQNKLGDAESCLLEATRRAPDNVAAVVAYLEVIRETQPRELYVARVESARTRFPGNADLAYFVARELATIEGAVARTLAAYEDFLLLAAPADPRRREAAAFLARVRGY